MSRMQGDAAASPDPHDAPRGSLLATASSFLSSLTRGGALGSSDALAQDALATASSDATAAARAADSDDTEALDPSAPL
jgi:hypothetical protein